MYVSEEAIYALAALLDEKMGGSLEITYEKWMSYRAHTIVTDIDPRTGNIILQLKAP